MRNVAALALLATLAKAAVIKDCSDVMELAVLAAALGTSPIGLKILNRIGLVLKQVRELSIAYKLPGTIMMKVANMALHTIVLSNPFIETCQRR